MNQMPQNKGQELHSSIQGRSSQSETILDSDVSQRVTGHVTKVNQNSTEDAQDATVTGE